MKKTINLLLFIGLLFISCEKKEANPDNEEEDGQEHVDARLKGTWQNQSGNAIYDGDEKGIYLKSATHAAWLSAIQGGLVTYGDAYIKNLTRKSDNEYACDILWFTRTNDVVTEVRYSSKSTITISADGKRIDIRSYGPWDDDLTTSVLLKQEEMGNNLMANIYLAGVINPVYQDVGGPWLVPVGKHIAAYWVNGKEVRLTNGTQYAYAAQILVSESDDVYVLGGVETDYNPGVSRGNLVLWKNGKIIKNLYQDDPNFMVGAYYPNLLAIHGQDWYVAIGRKLDTGGYTRARYSKNGQEILLKNYTQGHHNATCIGISEKGDVFVGGTIGWDFSNNQTGAPVCWKNGEPFLLEVPGGVDTKTSFQVVAMSIQGNDIYIAGSDESSFPWKGVCWKNGKLISLSTDVSRVYSIAVSGDVLYLTGEKANQVSATYWRNGIDQNVDVRLDLGTYPRTFTSENADIYLSSGHAYQFIRNGNPVSVEPQPKYTDRAVYFNSIFIKPYK